MSSYGLVFSLKCPAAVPCANVQLFSCSRCNFMANDGKEQINQVCIEVVNLNGKRLKFSVADSLTGHELQQMITNRLPRKEGAQVAVHHGSIPLSLKESLTQQGIGESTTLTYVYLPVDVHAAWCYMKGYSEDEFSLSGVTKIKVARPLVKALNPPERILFDDQSTFFF